MKNREPHRSRSGGHPTYWIYGRHAVAAAIANPRRRIRRVVAAEGARPPAAPGVETETTTHGEIAALLPPHTVHQGVAALAEPLESATPETVLDDAPAQAVAIALDHVTDPRNLGAVLRSAAAFGALGVIATSRHAPPEGGALAKAASGALETVPVLRAANLARTLGTAKAAGLWIVGLDMDAPEPLGPTPLPERCVFVLGSEGSGLRRLTRETCDIALHIPMRGGVGSLNVSASAAVALYEWARQARGSQA